MLLCLSLCPSPLQQRRWKIRQILYYAIYPIAFSKLANQEFLTHNPKKLILSESKLSYIIGNLASYDRRQYPAWFLHPDDPSKAIQIPSSPASPDPDGLFSPSDERKRSANGPFSPEQPTGASESKGSGSDNTTTEGKSHGKDITPEGQAFGHCLVIPKRRIFNIVDPIAVENHCKPIRELREHFIKFWNTKGGPEVILQRTRDGFDEQNKKLHAKIKSTPIPSSSSSSMTRQRTKEFAAKREAQLDSLMGDLEAAYHDMATQFLKLRAPQDFVFGFHPFPQNSVGHLHLHVYPRKDELREWSSKAHESKTVEIEEVLEAEGETLNGDTGR